MPNRVVADRYLLQEQVGRGGSGVVWRAEDQVLSREVAVKEVHLQAGLPQDERAALQERVLREARAAAMLNHSGAVTVYDVAEDAGQAYIVMELVDAPTLADLVEEKGPLPVPEVARIGLAVLDVLVAAHASGIVHRDLKPGNVLVAGDSVKLMDFGIAQIKDSPKLTSTGIVLGSPAYLSPEQARGEPVTPATDLWGLGATLFYAACGRPPFDRGEPIATLTAVAHDDLVVDPCAGALTPVLNAMLRKDSTSRPSVADLRSMLTTVADGNVVGVVPQVRRPAVARRRGRRRWPYAVLALLVTVAVAAFLAWRDDDPALSAARTFTTYTHPDEGWTAHFPPGWEMQPQPSSAVDFREPGTGRYLRVGYATTPPGDLDAAWRAATEEFAGSHDGYREIAFAGATYRDRPAVRWEYVWGNGLHATTFGFVAAGRGYSLTVQAREADWGRSQALFEAMRDQFEPAP